MTESFIDLVYRRNDGVPRVSDQVTLIGRHSSTNHVVAHLDGEHRTVVLKSLKQLHESFVPNATHVQAQRLEHVVIPETFRQSIHPFVL